MNTNIQDKLFEYSLQHWLVPSHSIFNNKDQLQVGPNPAPAGLDHLCPHLLPPNNAGPSHSGVLNITNIIHQS